MLNEIENIIYKKVLDNINNEGYYKELQGYYNGIYKIEDKQVGDLYKANNKVPVNFCKTIINTICSYTVGNPVSINHKIDADIQDFIYKTLQENDFADILYTALQQSCIKGKAYTLSFLNEEGKFNIINIPTENIIVNKNIFGKIEEAIRYYTVTDFYTEKDILVVIHYTNKSIKTYKEVKEGLVLVTEEDNKLGVIPVIEWLANKDGESKLKDIVPLIDSYNKVISIYLDEAEQLSNSYFVFRNVNLSKNAVDLMKKSSIIEILEDGGDAKFLTKSGEAKGIDNILDRLEKLIYIISETPNLNDEKFGEKSGVAILYKLLTLEAQAKQIERLFNRGIREVLKQLDIYTYFNINKRYNITEFDITWTRNIIKNIDAELDQAIKMKNLGILSDETILNNLTFITDAQRELEANEEEDK